MSQLRNITSKNGDLSQEASEFITQPDSFNGTVHASDSIIENTIAFELLSFNAVKQLHDWRAVFPISAHRVMLLEA